MKNFSVFLEELNGVFIEHEGTIFKIVGWEYIEPGYYRVVVKSDAGVIEVRVRDKELKENNILFHLYPYSYKREIALDILSKRIEYLYKIKKKRDSVPGELIDVDKNAGNISMTKKEIDNVIERMSKE